MEEQPPSEVGTTNENTASGFIKPAAGSYTSGFEKRGGQMHYGLDIAASGTVSVQQQQMEWLHVLTIRKVMGMSCLFLII